MWSKRMPTKHLPVLPFARRWRNRARQLAPALFLRGSWPGPDSRSLGSWTRMTWMMERGTYTRGAINRFWKMMRWVRNWQNK